VIFSLKTVASALSKNDRDSFRRFDTFLNEILSISTHKAKAPGRFITSVRERDLLGCWDSIINSFAKNSSSNFNVDAKRSHVTTLDLFTALKKKLFSLDYTA
jgi:hypothetical protein